MYENGPDWFSSWNCTAVSRSALLSRMSTDLSTGLEGAFTGLLGESAADNKRLYVGQYQFREERRAIMPSDGKFDGLSVNTLAHVASSEFRLSALGQCNRPCETNRNCILYKPNVENKG